MYSFRSGNAGCVVIKKKQQNALLFLWGSSSFVSLRQLAVVGPRKPEIHNLQLHTPPTDYDCSHRVEQRQSVPYQLGSSPLSKLEEWSVNPL